VRIPFDLFCPIPTWGVAPEGAWVSRVEASRREGSHIDLPALNEGRCATPHGRELTPGSAENPPLTVRNPAP